MKQSEVYIGSAVTFPEFTGERVYMREFVPGRDLPSDLERWQGTVDSMLKGVKGIGKAYLMIDQAEVPADKFHRRPGLHVDGYWYAGNKQLLSGGHGPYWSPTPTHSPVPSHGPKHGREHGAVGHPEALIIASNVEGCEAFSGEWHGDFGNGGDCSNVDIRTLTKHRMVPGIAYVGETGSMLHASIPLKEAAKRTVVRINLQGWVA